MVLVATKMDLAEGQRQVTEDQGYAKMKEIGNKCIRFRETTTFGNDVSPVTELFTEVAEQILNSGAGSVVP